MSRRTGCMSVCWFDLTQDVCKHTEADFLAQGLTEGTHTHKPHSHTQPHKATHSHTHTHTHLCIDLHSAPCVAPLKGRLPVMASYKMTPMDHISTDGPSYSLPAHCVCVCACVCTCVRVSGAANSGVPHCCVRLCPKGVVTAARPV